MKYITRSMNGITITNKVKESKQTGLMKYLNELCINNLSTYQGRIDAARIVLNQTQCVPLYVNDSIVLIPTKTIRHPEMIYINSQRIINIKQETKQSIVVFDDWSELVLDISYRLLHKRLKMAKRLLETLRTVG